MLENINWIQIITSLTILVVGYGIAQWMASLTELKLSKRLSRHQAQLFKRVVFYILLILFLVSALHQIGLKLSILLGAAGVLTVAVGFASQTAASNLVSGVFLLIEHPFKVGDIVDISGNTGTVESIDLLSTKLKAFNNTLIRIPNETVIKSAVTNLSYFPTRRIDIIIGIAYEESIDTVKALLKQVVSKHNLVLESPEPNIVINDFAESSVNLKLMVWAKSENYASVLNDLKEQIKTQFDKENIDIPFPQVTVHKA